MTICPKKGIYTDACLFVHYNVSRFALRRKNAPSDHGIGLTGHRKTKTKQNSDNDQQNKQNKKRRIAPLPVVLLFSTQIIIRYIFQILKTFEQEKFTYNPYLARYFFLSILS
jgi:hypothetical protein